MPEQAGYERAAAHAGAAGGMDAGTFAVSGTELQTANQRPYLYLLRHLSTTYKPGINYSNPDMRQIEAQSAQKNLPSSSADLGELIRQLQEQPGLASTLAQLLNGAVQDTTG